MKRLLFILFLALCATAPAQTIRTLGYNSTNGQVVAATNVVWTNAFSFWTNTVAAQVRSNLSIGWPALTATNAAATALVGSKTSLSGFGESAAYYTTVELVGYTNGLVFTNANILFGGMSATNEAAPPVGVTVSIYGSINLNPFNIGGGEATPFFTAAAPDGRAVVLSGEGLVFSNGADATTRSNLFGTEGASTNIAVLVSGGSTNTLVFTNGLLKEVQ